MTTTRSAFESWMEEVDRVVETRVGLSVHDLEDVAFSDWFEDGVSAKSAASRAIRNSMGGF
jgi:hypothetical protein